MIRQVDRTSIVVGIVVLVTLTFGVAEALPAFSQSDENSQASEPAAALAVGEEITYQGRLTDSDGNRLTGDYSMQFFLYDAESGGASVFDSGQMTVNVSDGLFTVSLPVPQSTFDGQSLWLSIEVEGQTLSPRQEVTPTPYAMGLRPGASIEQDTAGDGLSVQNVATGTAIRAESTHMGLYGESANFAVYGLNEGGPGGFGYGGYFTSTTGIGVFGGSRATPSTNNTRTPGVHGYSEHGYGVYGQAEALGRAGVYGEHGGSGIGIGLFGQAATGFGVRGVSDGDGVYGSGQAHGVYGTNTGPADGFGYGGYFTSTTGTGVLGGTTAVRTTTNTLPAGVYGYSEHGAAILGESGGQFALAGHFDGDVRVTGDLVIDGSKGGYVVDIAMNDSTEPLAQGDVVVVTGAADPVVGSIPVPLVQAAKSTGSTGVVGVVDRKYQDGQLQAGPAAPGEHLSIVTMGAFESIKADAEFGAIQPGDLLVSSTTPGHAMRADSPEIGTVIGKAMSPLQEGSGLVAVLVTLQ